MVDRNPELDRFPSLILDQIPTIEGVCHFVKVGDNFHLRQTVRGGSAGETVSEADFVDACIKTSNLPTGVPHQRHVLTIPDSRRKAAYLEAPIHSGIHWRRALLDQGYPEGKL